MLKRREFFQLSLLAGLAGIVGCGKSSFHPILSSASSENLPKELLKALPEPWVFKSLEVGSGQDLFQSAVNSGADLLAIGDGWIPEFLKEELYPIQSEAILSRLDRQAKEFLEGFGLTISAKILPIGVSPWVMLFRNGEKWLSRANEGWNVLLDPELTGHLVLPASPRLIMSLADRIEETDGLRKLRQQALTFDDRNGLNWLLSGKARVVILPLYRCFRSLSRDPRLSIAFPLSGAPLHWTVLVRPNVSKQFFPESWLDEAWSMPLLGKLLARGWIPPLPTSELLEAIHYLPDAKKTIILPPEPFWENSWSFSPLSKFEMKGLEKRWSQSTP